MNSLIKCQEGSKALMAFKWMVLQDFCKIQTLQITASASPALTLQQKIKLSIQKRMLL